MNFEEYLKRYYNGDIVALLHEEIMKPEHLQRISEDKQMKLYLQGKHRITTKPDMEWKKEKFTTTKLVIQKAKTILNIHNTYLLGKRVSLNGTENMVDIYNNVYRLGKFHNQDFNIIRKVNQSGNTWEYVYKGAKGITSKIINSDLAYPIYNFKNEYIAFIEYYKINQTEYWNLYTIDKVQEFNTEDGILKLEKESSNIGGLPIHYKNYSAASEVYGESELKDIIPILDKYEEIISKMIDSVYCLSLNPIGVATGQSVVGTMEADMVGQIINLDSGDFNFVTGELDYNSIKLILDNLKESLQDVSSTPSVAMGNSNIANVSEVSLKMLYELATKKAQLNEKWLRNGMEERWERIKNILLLQGVEIKDNEYIDCEFNYSIPQNTTEIITNLSNQYKDGAMSKETYIQISPLTTDVGQEMERIGQDNKGNEGNEVE